MIIMNDKIFRKILALSIGLEYIPRTDVLAFERIKGILADDIDSKYFDSEEIVKDVRSAQK